MSTTTTTSPLDHPYPAHENKPYFDLTVALLRGVRDHDFDALVRGQ